MSVPVLSAPLSASDVPASAAQRTLKFRDWARRSLAAVQTWRHQAEGDLPMRALNPEPRTLLFGDDGRIPNSRYPVLIYADWFAGARDASAETVAAGFENLFSEHAWPPDWRGGVYDYHHYHSTAHEALGIAAGNALLMLGGEHGGRIQVGAGDVLVLPAGTGHCAIHCSADLLVVGAYPRGQQWDVVRGAPGEREAAMQRIAALPLPVSDPVGGSLLSLWR
jgi:uncharacterized protein YjlB